jgi:hypothetical protein
MACLFERLAQWPEQFASKRKRRYTHEGTFWLFLGQVLCTRASCQEVVARFLSRLALCGQRASANNAAYCKARKRLPQEALDQVFEDIKDKALAPGADQWGGRNVKVVDGSSVSMPDTRHNQARYPQPTAQKEGCGFPVMRLVVLFSLGAGVVLAYAKGALSMHERTLFHELWARLEKADILLADRGFCSYADFCVLLERGIDCVMRKHARRGKTSVTKKRLGKNDVLMHWNKNNIRPVWLNKEAWDALPQTMPVREITFQVSNHGFRTTRITIATTLLDPKEFPAASFAELYRRRWRAELYLRDLKTTMGMEVLRCKSPEMIHKELVMHFIAYNLLRVAILDAAHRTKTSPHAIGFKACLATVRQWAPVFPPPHERPRKHARLYRALLHTIAAVKLQIRPDRIEPRARKRRPKNYPLLNKPRKQFKEIPHRNKQRAALS